MTLFDLFRIHLKIQKIGIWSVSTLDNVVVVKTCVFIVLTFELIYNTLAKY